MTLTGNPVRAAIRLLSVIPYPELSHDDHIRILVTGGSQGAAIFSQIVPAAIAALPGVLRSRIRIDQQCRPADLKATRAAYGQINVSADLSAFFTDHTGAAGGCASGDCARGCFDDCRAYGGRPAVDSGAAADGDG